jgi:5-methylcytosine-specific restriction endonuclease McrA
MERKYCSVYCSRRAAQIRAHSANVVDRICPICGETFTRFKHTITKYCSRACFAVSRKKTTRTYVSVGRTWDITCGICGVLFKSDQYRKYCSSDCSREGQRLSSLSSRKARKEAGTFKRKSRGKRYHSSFRKAQKLGVECERVSAKKVFERDGWKCKICGRPTPVEFRGTIGENAPELDHIVPLSKGGGHTYANTQCLCRSCNWEKSDMSHQEYVSILDGRRKDQVRRRYSQESLPIFAQVSV